MISRQLVDELLPDQMIVKTDDTIRSHHTTMNCGIDKSEASICSEAKINEIVCPVSWSKRQANVSES